MQGLVTFVKTLGPARIAAMGAVTAALIGFFAFVILRVTAPQMVPLFTDLTLEDSAAIIKDLERQSIVYELKNEGAIILVPKEKVGRLRMKLAEGGLPKGGGIGYEIFDKSDSLGTTSFVQNINHLRALEGELARTIRSIDRVQGARVHLVIPERPLFSRDKLEPSASIALKVRGQLESQQVRAIRHLVASAVNGLKPERVSVVDETGRLLADGAANDPYGTGASGDERKLAYERHLRDQVESIISSVVGPGRARVQLTAEFDFNRVTQTQDRFDPEGRVLRSSQTREEQSSTTEQQGQVSVSTELPNAQQGQQAASPRDQSKKTEEINNYEITRITETKVIEGGRVNRVSVAVLVDGIYGRNDKGELVYQERSKDELDRIAMLVRSAIGFDQRRGDQVEVVNLRFAETQSINLPEPTGLMGMLQFTKEDVMRAIELGVMLLLGLVVLIFVIRPLVRRIITPESIAALTGAPMPTPALAGVPAGIPDGIPQSEEEAKAVSSQTSKMIEFAQVQGSVHAQSIQKVGELAERNPQETVQILRQWLHETN
ncbi:flagellar basal-body MS-ring/collar protein FliF [Rhodoplanes sp. TEM]|uniref:Flagellar M-ring protein n=1 Tax=Rhodoplanes tepidamans TaxID=200616 RepID=A0ABT5J4X2_RHOTP|nr:MULTISPECIES: flagellar basal-body MS-ring/collar protein FliF [Rhodoplanes]MDC7784682.1 flagellar basal-body MS-ring/collar protein FliF [Rhodoplanes tepidamans]MDC7982149.1 flagellar basal-body MS-ring/collar protein FliF [Rhodoplanes sp. TEM]